MLLDAHGRRYYEDRTGRRFYDNFYSGSSFNRRYDEDLATVVGSGNDIGSAGGLGLSSSFNSLGGLSSLNGGSGLNGLSGLNGINSASSLSGLGGLGGCDDVASTCTWEAELICDTGDR